MTCGDTRLSILGDVRSGDDFGGDAGGDGSGASLRGSSGSSGTRADERRRLSSGLVHDVSPVTEW